MQCPYCGKEDTKIIDSRSSERKKRRRRECTNCGGRFTTFEVVERPLVMVIKRDGSFEPFDRNKLMRGVFNAVKKRPVTLERVNDLVDDIENSFLSTAVTEITSEELGNKTLELLKDIDDVAYIRFASVYKAFTSVEEFINAISELGDTPYSDADKFYEK